MKTRRFTSWPQAVLCTLGLLAMASIGCQSTISGQTMPSGYYLTDDIQYHRAGPEDRYPNARRALEQYKLDQQNIQDGLNEQP